MEMAADTSETESSHMDRFELIGPAARPSKRRGALLVLLLSSALAVIGAASMSMAFFTDSRDSTGSWSAGTIVLGVSPTTTFTPTDMMPGATGNQTVVVSNTGTGALRYAMSGTSTNADLKALADQVDLTIQVGSCASPGATLFSGKLSTAALGSSAQGQDTGDRTVAVSSSDTLCFSWSFPFASGNSYQGAATSTTFTFEAEQTANNP